MKKLLAVFLVFVFVVVSAGCGGRAFVKTASELEEYEGVVVFPIEVNETYSNGEFLDSHADVCSLSVYNDAVKETISMFPLSSKKITAAKSWRMLKTKKYYTLPAGKYVTFTLEFGSGFTFWGLDSKENKTGMNFGHAFKVAPGKVNYWGKCVINLTYDRMKDTIMVTSLTIKDNEAQDMADFKRENPGLAGMDVVKNIGVRL